MWARRCGARPGWPSGVKVLIQSLATGAVGFAVFQYMSAADVGYLDLEKPKNERVLCLRDWPLRHNIVDWMSPSLWEEWAAYRTDMADYIEQHKCLWHDNATQCVDADVPLRGMGKNLGISLGSFYFWGNDAVEIYGYMFLWLTVCMWIMVTVHDLALLTLSNRDYVLDLQSIRRYFPCWRKLWILVGFRCWKRLLRGRGLLIGQRHFCRRVGRVVSIIAAPLFVVWGLFVFHLVVIPVVTLFFLCYPARLSRVLIFLNSLATGVIGVMLSVHSIVFLADVSQRQTYAVTWTIRQPVTGASCACGCIYPLSFGRCLSLLLIGVVVAYKAFVLAFRCLKGLRRSNWANLMSVLFPVPLTVYEVMWTQPDGSPIMHRKEGDPVQGELAFDPFALMDEQPDSGRTTLTLVPTPINEENEPALWSVDDVALYLQELGLAEHCDAFRKNGVDGATLLDLLRSGDAGLQQLGVTAQLQISRIRGRLSFLKGAVRKGLSSSDIGAQRTSRLTATGATPRRMAGPSPVEKELPKKRGRKEFIGCCGFPCIKGEHSTRRSMKKDTESDEEDSCDFPPEAKAALGLQEASANNVVDEELTLPVVPSESCNAVPHDNIAGHTAEWTASRFLACDQEFAEDRPTTPGGSSTQLSL